MKQEITIFLIVFFICIFILAFIKRLLQELADRFFNSLADKITGIFKKKD